MSVPGSCSKRFRAAAAVVGLQLENRDTDEALEPIYNGAALNMSDRRIGTAWHELGHFVAARYAREAAAKYQSMASNVPEAPCQMERWLAEGNTNHSIVIADHLHDAEKTYRAFWVNVPEYAAYWTSVPDRHMLIEYGLAEKGISALMVEDMAEEAEDARAEAIGLLLKSAGTGKRWRGIEHSTPVESTEWPKDWKILEIEAAMLVELGVVCKDEKGCLSLAACL
jgi:hypothetical protein